MQISKRKYLRIKMKRIILSLCLPTFLGVFIYSFSTGFYQEPLFWFAFMLSLPTLLLIAFIPSFIYTILMELVGIFLFHGLKPSDRRFAKVFLFLVTGSGIWNLYLLVADNRTSLEWHLIITLTALLVSILKLRFHLKERGYSLITRNVTEV